MNKIEHIHSWFQPLELGVTFGKRGERHRKAVFSSVGAHSKIRRNLAFQGRNPMALRWQCAHVQRILTI